MKNLRIYLLSAACVATLAMRAQTTQKLTATKANDYGLIYTLPNTAIDVTLEAKCTVVRPGEFHNYARKYLKAEPVTRESRSWQLISATLTPRAVADDDQRYSVQFKSGSPVTLILSADNAPLAVNDEAYAPRTPDSNLPQAQPASQTILDTPAARQAMTEEMMQSTSTAKRAELAAAKIYELRQSRNDLISGNADAMPPDGKAMQLALDNLTAQEEALTAMFLGTTSTSTEVVTLPFMPGTESQRVIVARLSPLDGIVASTDLSGAPVYLDYNVVSRGELPLTDRGEERRFPKGGLAYRIPGTATVTVTYEGEKLASSRFNIPQLGVVFGMDPSVFSDKKAPAYVHFDPLTGAILETGAKRQ